MKKRASRAGYSLIEVMTAVGVMVVGSTGIGMMIGATSRANDDAWETTTAAAFASTWMERVKRDSLLWTAAGVPNTQYMSAATLNGAWFVPTTNFAATGESVGADAFGWDTETPGQMRYCINLANQPVHALGALTNAVRVNLRVAWSRTVRGDGNVVDHRAGPAASNCASPLAASSPLIREMYLSTVVHWVAP